MTNHELINKVAHFLIRSEIGRIESELPEIPDISPGSLEFHEWETYFGDSFSKQFSKKYEKIKNRTASIKKILDERVIVVGETSELKESYNAYITSRIHEFAEAWLAGEKPTPLQEIQNRIKKNKENPYNPDIADHIQEEQLKRNDDEAEWAKDMEQERTLEIFNLETWEELIEVVESVNKYAFKSATPPNILFTSTRSLIK